MLSSNPRSALSPSLFADLVSIHLIDHSELFQLKSMLRLAAIQSSLVVYLSTSYASLSLSLSLGYVQLPKVHHISVSSLTFEFWYVQLPKVHHISVSSLTFEFWPIFTVMFSLFFLGRGGNYHFIPYCLGV